MSKITSERVLELLRDGWELGLSTAGRDRPNAWLQRKLCHGGESHNVDMRAFRALLHSGKIVGLPGRKGDGFWLSRFGLPK